MRNAESYDLEKDGNVLTVLFYTKKKRAIVHIRQVGQDCEGAVEDLITGWIAGGWDVEVRRPA